MPIETAFEPREEAERAVHELRGESSITRFELHRALELGVERGSGKRAILEDARQDRCRNPTCVRREHRGGDPTIDRSRAFVVSDSIAFPSEALKHEARARQCQSSAASSRVRSRVATKR